MTDYISREVAIEAFEGGNQSNYGAKTYADALNCCADMREETNETV